MADVDTYKDIVYFDDAMLGPTINFVTCDEGEDKFYNYKYYIDSGVCIKGTGDEKDYSTEFINEEKGKKIVEKFLSEKYNTTLEKTSKWIKNNISKKVREAHDAFDVFFDICATEPLEEERIVLKDDDITYLSCALAVMMASMEAYNLNPEEDFFYDGALSMQEAFVNKMRELGVGEPTIGAIVAECGGCYGYKDGGSEEDEDIIALFMPDAIKERLERKDEE